MSIINREVSKFLQLAIPLAGAQLAQALTGFFDSLMMGRLGTEVLAGGGLATLTFTGLVLTAGGLLMGMTPAIAQAAGAGTHKLLANWTRQGFWLVVLLALPLTVIVAHFTRVMGFLGQAETTVQLASTYLAPMAWAVFPALGFIWLRGLVSGLSQGQPIVLIVSLGTIFNIGGNYSLAFGKWGLPRLELAGLAWATVVTHWGMFLALLCYVLKHAQLQQYLPWRQLGRIKLELLQELIRVGLPIAIFSALEIGLFTVVTYLMGILGTDILAAHQIVFQTIAVIFMLPLGMSLAATVRVGQWLGQENWSGVKRAGSVSIGVGIIIMIGMALALLMFPQAVMALYLNLDDPRNEPVIALVRPMLTIAALAQVCDGVQKIAYGALQGLQDTRLPMLLSIPAFWLVGLPLGYWWGFYSELAGVGLWLGQSMGVAIAAVIFTWRFYYLIQVQRN